MTIESPSEEETKEETRVAPCSSDAHRGKKSQLNPARKDIFFHPFMAVAALSR